MVKSGYVSSNPLFWDHVGDGVGEGGGGGRGHVNEGLYDNFRGKIIPLNTIEVDLSQVLCPCTP